MNPTVSTIVPIYNGGERLRLTLNSLILQTYSAHEVVLIDDGSTDESPRIIEEFSKRHNVVAIRQENAGVAAARNAGISAASGELIAFCDQDDLWMPRKLEVQVPLFAEGVGLVYSGVEFRYPDMSRKSIPQGTPANLTDLLQNNTICSCTAVTRKNLLESVGMFEADRALMGVDDWHLWLRLLCVTDACYVADVLAVHVVHENNYSRRETNMLRASLACLENLSQDETIISQKLDIRAAKHKVYAHYAKNLIHCGEFDDALSCMRDSLKLNPLDLRTALKFAALSALPNPLLKAMQQTKRAGLGP